MTSAESAMPGNSTPPIIIIGMHRSGTTLVAELIGHMGVHTGNRKKRHEESATFRRVNERLLRERGAHWAKPEPFLAALREPDFVGKSRQTALEMLHNAFDEFGVTLEGRQWGWKDPRTTLTLPVWELIYPEAKIIHVVRNGVDVALSLYRREMKTLWRRATHLRIGGARELMIPPTIVQGYRLWEIYTRAALAEGPHCHEWLTIRYEDLVSSAVDIIGRLCQFIGINLSPERLRQLAKDYVRENTKRSALELIRLRVLMRLGQIRPDLMQELGYEDIIIP